MALSTQSSVSVESSALFHGRFPARFLFISIVVHACLFLVAHFTVSWPVTPKRQEVFPVELLTLPSHETFHDADPTEAFLPEALPIDSFALLDEETIRLGDREGKYADYAGLIKDRIDAAWVYPEEAKLEAVEGNVRMRFTVEKDGALSGSWLLASSGYRILDENVIAAVELAAPFPPFPQDFTISRLHIEASFLYRLGR